MWNTKSICLFLLGFIGVGTVEGQTSVDSYEYSSFTFPVTVTCCCANAFTEMNSNKAQQARMSLHERFSFLLFFMIRLIVNISF